MPSNKIKNASRICLQSTLLALLLSSTAYAQDDAPSIREQQASQLRVEVDARIAELDEEYAARAAELREQLDASKQELYENTEDVFQRSNEETAINRVYQDALASLQREINSRRNAVYAAQREANGQLIMEGAISPSTWVAISPTPLVGTAVDSGGIDSGSSIGSIGTEAATRELPEGAGPYRPSIRGFRYSIDGDLFNVLISGSDMVPTDRDSVGVRFVPGDGLTRSPELDMRSWANSAIVGITGGPDADIIQNADSGEWQIFWKPDGYIFARLAVTGRTDAMFGALCAHAEDADGDGRMSIACGGDDCDDGDANRFPGNPEVSDSTGHDEDCNPDTLGVDGDGDGFYAVSDCNPDGDGGLKCGNDCDDNNPLTNIYAVDICDGFDNNCDGTTDDEGNVMAWYADNDRDLFGDASGAAITSCALSKPAGWVDNNYDCDDSDPTINPITGHCAPGQ